MSFRNIRTPLAEACWLHIDRPRETLTPGVFAYDAAVELSEAQMEPIYDKVQELLAEARKENPRFPKSDDKVRIPIKPARGPRNSDGSEGEIKPGRFLLTTKQNEKRADGSMATRPIVVGADGIPFRPDEIPPAGTGSKVILSFDLYAYATGGNFGVGAGLRGVQLATVETGAPTFDPIDTSSTEGSSVFSDDPH